MSMMASLHSIPDIDLAGLRAKPDVPQEFCDNTELSLGKSWDVLTHVLSTGQRYELGWAKLAILGGEPFGDDRGYGQPRTFSAQEVAAIASELGTIDERRFRELFRSADLSDTYSAESYNVGEALEEFLALRACYVSAAAAGRAMVLFM